MWIVMTSAAHMPSSCKGRYRNVAIVKVCYYGYNRGDRPAMISRRARGVLDLVHLGHHSVGKTDRCAYARALREAESMALRLNTEAPEAEGDLLMSYGSA